MLAQIFLVVLRQISVESGAQLPRGREKFCPGVLPGTFLKMDEKYLDFAKESVVILEKNTPFVCIDGSNSHLKCSFKSVLEKKHQMLSLQGSLFVCHTGKLY